MSTQSSLAGVDRAWGWVAHLRDGGTTPWLQWYDAAPAGGVLPGAQQLELLRRLNAAHPGVGRELAGRVLTTPTAGRGKPDLPLVGAAPTAYGPRPVDPAMLPARELTRVGVVLLAEDLVSLDPPPRAEASAPPWRRHYQLVGDPLLAAALRDDLTARRRPPGGARPVVVVAAGPVDQLMAHAWTRRCFEEGVGPLAEWVRFWRERDRLPPRLDLVAQAARWTRWRGHVRVVTDPARLPATLRARGVRLPEPPGADVTELARRIAAVTGFLVPAVRRAELMSRVLLPRIPRTATPPVALPDTEREWLTRASASLVRQLGVAGYPVVGDLADLAPRFDGASPDGSELDALVLDLAVRMLVDRSWQQGPHTTTEGQGRG